VQKFAGAILAEDEPGADGFPECCVHRLHCCPVNLGQSDLGDIAQAGELLQGVLGAFGEPLQLLDHEIRHVVGVALGADAIDVPVPGSRD
jgi:hypothetical protein